MKIENTDAQVIPVRLEILSPVHIGSGEKFSPMEYQIVQDPDGYFVYTVSCDEWMSDLPPQASLELANEFSSASLTKVWEILRNKLPRESYLQAKSRTSEEICALYNKRLKSGNSDNELSISTRNPLTQAMLIPGSSIKGAIRTAIMDFHDKGELRDAGKQGYNEQIQNWFGKIGENAFQALKIQDFELLATESEFVRASERSKNHPRVNDMKGICEVAPTSVNPKFGKITMGRLAKKSSMKLPLGSREPWTFENLRNICHAFYYERFKKEMSGFYSLPQFAGSKVCLERIEQRLLSPETKNAILLRVGHFSHIESVTMSKNKPEPPVIKGKQMPHGTTRTLANGIAPFGWVLLHPCSEEEYAQGVNQFKQEQQNIKELFQQKKNAEKAHLQEKAKQEQEERAQREQRAKLVEEQRLQALKEEEVRKEEARRRKEEKLQREQEAQEAKAKQEERLASLSPVERAFEKTLAKTANREEVLNAFENREQCAKLKELAEAIKNFWTKEKMWNDKKLKDNQKARVKIIQDILKSS